MNSSKRLYPIGIINCSLYNKPERVRREMMEVTEIQICFICGHPSVGKDICDGCGGGQPSELYIPEIKGIIKGSNIEMLQGA